MTTGSDLLGGLQYRVPIVTAIMNCVVAGESCALVGVSGVGKSALLRFIRRVDVKEHYLGEEFNRYLFLNVDNNLLVEPSEWGMFEFMLNQITQAAEDQPEDVRSIDLIQQSRALYWEAQSNKNKVLAQRHLSRSVGLLLRTSFDKIAFFLDEFDSVVREFDLQFFNNLRGLRDEYRPNVVYVTLTRQMFPFLRKHFDQQAEPFFEIFSRNVFALTPYNPQEAHQIISALMSSSRTLLDEPEIKYLIIATGGHAGLIKAAFDLLCHRHVDQSKDAFDDMAADPNIVDECKKIWLSLAPVERQVLWQVVKMQTFPPSENAVLDHLITKGMVKNKGKSGTMPFSPLFADFVKHQSAP